MLDELLKFVPPSHRSAYLGLLDSIPPFVRTIGVFGDSGAALGYLLKKKNQQCVYGVVHRDELLPVAEKIFDGADTSTLSRGEIPMEQLDAVLLCNLEEDGPFALELLAQLAGRLPSRCFVYALFGDSNFGTEQGASAFTATAENLESALGALKFGLANAWTLNQVTGDGTVVPLARLMVSVSEDYDVFAHADELIATQGPAAAFELVESIPQPADISGERCVLIHWKRLNILAARLETEPPEEKSFSLAHALDSFYALSFLLPFDPVVYQTMARCWCAVGDYDMALRLLRSISFRDANESVRQQLEALPAPAFLTKRIENIPSDEPHGPRRILFLMNPRPHYGMDVLYDGLCTCLGDENVVDYPFKPWLHGEDSEEHKNYPCRFNRDGRPHSLEEILAQLDAGTFDLILFADVEGDLPQAEMKAIVHRAKACPVAILDAVDELSDYRARVAEDLNFDGFSAYFKREKHRAIDYGPNCYPLPFAYDSRKTGDIPWEPRTAPFFWAGHRMFGMRRLYLETLEARHGWNMDISYSQADYTKQIRSSLMGLNCFGRGFDTVRYWELPAHGCLLVSERLPIEIPYDFVDGEHAVFFDDLQSLVEKVDYYIAHPEEAERLARAGQGHFLRYHTNEARAKQLLGWMFQKSGA